MPKYNLTEYSNNYSKTSESLWQFCRDELDDNITDFKSFKIKSRFTSNIGDDSTVDVEIPVSLKYLGN